MSTSAHPRPAEAKPGDAPASARGALCFMEKHPETVLRAAALVEEAVEAHADVPLDEADPASAALSTREKARAVLDTLRRAGWLEDEERSDWQPFYDGIEWATPP